MAVTFTRNSTAYKKDGTLVNTNQPRFEGGRFGQAVMKEEGTLNRHNVAASRGRAMGAHAGSIVTSTVDVPDPFGGISAVRVEASGGTNVTKAFATALPMPEDGEVVSAQIWVRNRIATSLIVHSNLGGRANTVLQTEGWRKIIWESIVGNGIQHSQHLLRTPTVDDIIDCDIAWLQNEKKPYVTSWHIGADTRAPETLTIPTATVLSPAVGTNEKHVRLLRSLGTNEQFIFDGGGAANRNLQILIATNGRPTLRYGTGTATVEIQGTTAWVRDTWYAIAWRWSPAGVTLFVNGAVVASSAIAPDLAFGDVAWLGSRADGTLQVGGLADDIRISSVARTDAEILSGFSSGLPLPVDMDTTAKYLFDNTLDAVKQASAGSSAAVAITAQGAGSKQASGSSSTALAITAQGAGLKQARAGSATTLATTSQGAGSKQARAGSATTLATTAQGAGLKQARAGSATTLATTSQGVGSKRGQGGSFAPLGISAQGWGYKLLRRIFRLVGTLREKIKLKGVL